MTIDRVATAAFGVFIESSVRTACLAALAAIALYVARPRRAATSLGVWTAVLALACVIPLIEAIAPTVWPVPVVTSIAAQPQPVPFPVVPARSNLISIAVPTSESFGAAQPHEVHAAAPSAGAIRPRRPIDWMAVTAVGYLFIVLTFAAQLFAGWRATRSLRRRGRSIEDADAVRAAMARVMPAGRVPLCALVESDAVVVPISVGLRCPAVVLPISWREWSTDTLDAVLAHELSHVARGDAWRQIAALVYRAAFWPNPMAWLLRRIVIDLAERASDEAALDVSADRTRYAEVLLRFFGQTAGSQGRADWSLAMARGRGAERRIARVLAWEPARRARSRVTSVAAIALVAPLAGTVIAATPTRIATGLSAPAFRWNIKSDSSSRPQEPDWIAVPLREWSAASGPGAVAGLTPATESIESQTSQALSTPPMAQRAAAWTDFSGRRRVLFMFDLTHLSDQGLRDAAARASSYADGMSTRYSVGLDTVHLWSVSALGASSTAVAFSRVAAAVAPAAAALGPRSASGPSVSTKTLEGVCDIFAGDHATADDFEADLSPIERRARELGRPLNPPQDTKLVVLFSDSVDALASGSESLAATRRSCNDRGVSLLALTSSGMVWPDDGTTLPDVAMSTPPQSDQSTASSIDAVVPQRNITLLFDLREVGGVTLSMDLERAALLMSMTNDAVRRGLAVEHRFSVATLSDHVDKLSDSVESFSQLMDLMRGFTETPAANVTQAARDRALNQYCDDLGGRFYYFNDPSSDQAVVYFGNPRTMMNAGPLYMALSANACRTSHVQIYFDSVSLYQQIQARIQASLPPPVAVHALAAPAGSPVVLEKVGPTVQGGYVLVTVHNTSPKPVRSVTLQAIIRNRSGALVGRALRRAGPETLIDPGRSVDVGSLLVDNADLAAAGPQPTVEVSVVEVDFIDGTTWRSSSAAQDPRPKR